MKKIIAVLAAAVILAAMLCGCSEMSIGKELLSGTDVIEGSEQQIARWEQAADDEAYIAMMNEKIQEYISGMTEISAMRERLAGLGGAKEIEKDAEFAAASQSMTQWCQGAVGYLQSSLTGEGAKEICGLCSELGSATSVYLENLPALLSGEYSGEVSEEQYLNGIIDNAIEIYNLLLAEQSADAAE